MRLLLDSAWKYENPPCEAVPAEWSRASEVSCNGEASSLPLMSCRSAAGSGSNGSAGMEMCRDRWLASLAASWTPRSGSLSEGGGQGGVTSTAADCIGIRGVLVLVVKQLSWMPRSRSASCTCGLPGNTAPIKHTRPQCVSKLSRKSSSLKAHDSLARLLASSSAPRLSMKFDRNSSLLMVFDLRRPRASCTAAAPRMRFEFRASTCRVGHSPTHCARAVMAAWLRRFWLRSRVRRAGKGGSALKRSIAPPDAC